MIFGLSQFFISIHKKANADSLGFLCVGASQNEWDAAQLAQEQLSGESMSAPTGLDWPDGPW